MPFVVGDRVSAKKPISNVVGKGSKGNVTGVILGGLYDVQFDEDPNGQLIQPPADETVSERSLEPA